MDLDYTDVQREVEDTILRSSDRPMLFAQNLCRPFWVLFPWNKQTSDPVVCYNSKYCTTQTYDSYIDLLKEIRQEGGALVDKNPEEGMIV